MPDASALSRAIQALGGPAEFRAALDISPRTLASWRKTGVPDTRWADVVKATNGAVRASDLANERASALGAAQAEAA